MKIMRFVSRQMAWIFAYSFLISWMGCPLEATEASSSRVSPPTANFALMFPSQLVRPGSQLEVVVQFYIEPGWHLYWKNPGDTGLAPTFDWQLPAGMKMQEMKWPVPSYFERGGTAFYGYDKAPQWIATFDLDENMAEGTYPITLSAFWLACDGSCVPSSQQFEISLTVSASAPPLPPLQALIEAKKNIPIPIGEGSAVLEKDLLVLRIPVSEEKTARINSVIVFPETSGIFTVDQHPVWKRIGDILEISINCLPHAKDRLIQSKRFIGLVQLRTPSSQTTYALDIPTQSSAASSGPAVSLSTDSQWIPVDPSQGRNALHANNAMNIILLLAFVGGMLLNITPCVLPVVGLKILTLISFRNLRWWQTLPHGVLFTAGVLATFWILAGGLYLFEHLGMTIGWGFQLQEPHFVAALIILLFCFAMNLFGLFEIGTSISAWASEVGQGVRPPTPSYASSFMSGALATLIATPCTGPLLGSVLGFAAVFSPLDGMLLFSAIGLGVAFPFFIISAFPVLIRFLPKPGMWMIGVKQFFGFCILATIAWLVWVLNAEISSLSISVVVCSMVLISFGLWILGLWGSPVRSLVCRQVGRAVASLFILGGILVFATAVDSRIAPWIQKVLPARKSIQWEPFSKERLDKELAKGHVVFVEFSAKWCLTCQTNALSFLSGKVIDAFQSHNIVALEADWTNGDSEITLMLRSLGRNGVPVCAIFRDQKEPVILPEMVTPDAIIQAISSTSEESGR